MKMTMKDDKFSRLKYWWEKVEKLHFGGDDETLRNHLYLLDAEIRNTLKGNQVKKKFYFLPLSVASILLVLASLLAVTLFNFPFAVQRSPERARVFSKSDELASEIPTKFPQPQAESHPTVDKSFSVGKTAAEKSGAVARPQKTSFSSSARSRGKREPSASAPKADEIGKKASTPTTESAPANPAEPGQAEPSEATGRPRLDALKLLLTLEDGLMGR